MNSATRERESHWGPQAAWPDPSKLQRTRKCRDPEGPVQQKPKWQEEMVDARGSRAASMAAVAQRSSACCVSDWEEGGRWH